MDHTTPEHYKEKARTALTDPVLQKALDNLQVRFGRGAAAAYQRLPEGPGLRKKAHAIRMEAVENLDLLLEKLAAQVRRNGGHVYFARDARAANAYCLQVARRNKVKLVVKGKSMVSEEIGLNRYLAANGIEAVETDLGEYIVQLAAEHPSHIIAPAIHKTRVEIGKLFSDKLGIDYIEDPPALTRAARKALREKFLAADMGITGCNLACAETGHITTLSNEGNIRMSSTLPKVHIAIMGMERVTARLQDHQILFRLLSRGAAAQTMAGYVSYIGAARQPGQSDGPDEFHLVILDNGRTRILADEDFREILCCIRCAACLNVCPVYAEIGGFAYGSPYCGPVGAIVTPLLSGIERAKHLFFGETLCGACKDICPVDIDLPRMLLELRARYVEGDPAWQLKPGSTMERSVYRFWSWLISQRRRYDLFLRAAEIGQRLLPHKADMIQRMPPPVNGWTRTRHLRPPARASFRQRWQRHRDTHKR